jgi:hypothetical protein
MKFSSDILKKKHPCEAVFIWYKNNGSHETVEATIEELLASTKPERLNWTNWLLSRMLSRKNKVRYAIFAAEQVIDIYEKKYPDDKRPRIALGVANEYLEISDHEISKYSLKIKAAAYGTDAADGAAAAAAAYAADAAAAAYGADDAYAAAYANGADAYAADAYADATAAAAADAAAYAADAAYAAAGAVGVGAAAARDKMKLKIINYGLSLIEQETDK